MLKVLAHVVVFAASLFCAFLLVNNMSFHPRTDDPSWSWLTAQFPLLLILFLAVKLALFGVLGQYRACWRYVGTSDFTGICRASLLSTFLIVLVWWLSIVQNDSMRRALPAIANISQGMFFADVFATVLLMGGLRAAVRLYYDEFTRDEAEHVKRLLIVGAGNSGESFLREVQRTAGCEYEVAGFVDDDPSKQRMKIRGRPVLGTVEQISEICEQNAVEEIVIAMPSVTGNQRRRVGQACEDTKVRTRTLPSMVRSDI
jgi:FlaA1/EpsC-like NDP-sugar epimerase